MSTSSRPVRNPAPTHKITSSDNIGEILPTHAAARDRAAVIAAEADKLKAKSKLITDKQADSGNSPTAVPSTRPSAAASASSSSNQSTATTKQPSTHEPELVDSPSESEGTQQPKPKKGKY